MVEDFRSHRKRYAVVHEHAAQVLLDVLVVVRFLRRMDIEFFYAVLVESLLVPGGKLLALVGVEEIVSPLLQVDGKVPVRLGKDHEGRDREEAVFMTFDEFRFFGHFLFLGSVDRPGRRTRLLGPHGKSFIPRPFAKG